ncbi:MAG: hypothetical protein J5I91_07775 [Bacteroidetes bacterium]|nr:hypothetical protein [Bacteroidota bacterium]
MELYFHSLVSLAEARFAASSHPKFIGFCFTVHSPNHISPIDFIKIRSWLSGGELVAQFLYEPISSINLFLESLQIKWIEIPADHPDIEELSKQYRIITVKDSHPLADFSRLRTFDNATHKTEGIFLDIENLSNASEIIAQQNPFGIALSGGHAESEPGMTDLSQWMDLMEELDIH